MSWGDREMYQTRHPPRNYEYKFLYSPWVLLRSVPDSHRGSKFAYLESRGKLDRKKIIGRPKCEWGFELLRRYVRRYKPLVPRADWRFYEPILSRYGSSLQGVNNIIYRKLPHAPKYTGRLRLDSDGVRIVADPIPPPGPLEGRKGLVASTRYHLTHYHGITNPPQALVEAIAINSLIKWRIRNEKHG